MLADGTAFSQNVQIGEDNKIPVYASPYSATVPGLLFGWLDFTNLQALPGPWGELTWIKKASASGLFKAGFTNLPVGVMGSPWSNSLPLSNVLLTSSLLTLSNGNLASPLTFDVSLNKTNLVLTPTPATTTDSGAGSVNTNTGQLTFTVTNGTGTGKVILTGHGAVLQDSQSGGGFFLVPSPTNAGSIWLEFPFPLGPGPTKSGD